MAVEGDAKEIRAHMRSYDRFVSLMKWGGGISVLVALLWIVFVAQ